MSKLTFFSVGIVAENKALSSDTVEVSPVEELPLLNGEITSNAEEIEITSVNSDNQSYSSKTYATNTVPAMWLPLSGGNRVTAPDVRRGAVVMLYQMADEKKYYWTTLKNDLQLRKLETVVYAFSATQNEAAAVNGENYYYLEISTHKKLVTFHTSKANGEPFTYDIQLDTGNGSLLIKDDINNFILLDSKQKQIRIENSIGSFFEIVDKDANLNVPGDFNLDIGRNYNRSVGGKSAEESGSTHTITSSTNTLDAPQNNIAGNFSVSGGRGGSTGSATIDGNFLFKDTITVQKKATFSGIAEAYQLISITNIQAPNI